ncbi:MAG: RidA family protein [Thalassobaculum sp.]|uniref:RidA family protein n=1 Tax=Thalassobaculum sp. TaxID=2022740 RepID=UPI0032EDDB49
MPIERLMVAGQMVPVSHYCHVVKAGDWIWLSGMVGMRADGSIPEDTVGQFEIALESIDTCLRAAGGRPDQIVKVQVFMTDIAERARINPVRQRYFGEHRPASTLVEVSALVDPRMTVEIEAVAYIGA